MSILDSDKTVKKATETLHTEHTSTPGAEREQLSPEGEPIEPAPGRAREPLGGPKLPMTFLPPFAITSNRQILLSVEACPDLKLEGRPIYRWVVLTEEEEAAHTIKKFENAIHDVAGVLGGMILRREAEESEGKSGKRRLK